MTNKSKMLRFLSLSLAATGFLVIGSVSHTSAQTRDPFEKPGWAKPKTINPVSPNSSSVPKTEKPPKPIAPAIMPVPAPNIEQRIAYYKRMREAAATNGQEIPKVTSVLTLDEMSVIGIFRTPRGYAAMVEARPIKLSYTIYPGESFFDGQLVAIEENKLIFRKVTKMSNNKFISSVENKALREYTIQEEVQGTAPVPTSSTQQVAATNATPANTTPVQTTVPTTVETPAQVTTAVPSVIVSPLDEMNKQMTEQPKDASQEKDAKKVKKPTKVAKNKN